MLPGVPGPHPLDPIFVEELQSFHNRPKVGIPTINLLLGAPLLNQ